MSRPTPETISHSLALTFTAGIGAFLLVTQHPELAPQSAATTTIEVALEPELSPPAPPAPNPEPPKPVRPIVRQEVRQPVAAPLMAAVVNAPAAFSPPEASPPNSNLEVPPPAKMTSETIDAQYAASLRSNIDSRTAPPSSAEYRLLKPHGEVRVNFMLDRSGMMISSELARSSGSGLLDRHALEIVRSGRYPPFPEMAFQGESRHSFLITLEFHS